MFTGIDERLARFVHNTHVSMHIQFNSTEFNFHNIVIDVDFA